MKEFIYSRNAVYETLRAKRRDVFSIQIAEGVQEKGRLTDILSMAKERRIPVEKVQRGRLDKIHQNHQGVVAEVSGYSYSDVVDILEHASQKNEPPFILLLDSLNDPQNFGTLLRTAEAIGVHGVIIPLAHTVEVTPAVVNASSGASEHLLIARSNLAQAIDTLKRLKSLGRRAGSGRGNGRRRDSRHLNGSRWVGRRLEGEGIRQLIRSKCDIVLKLPMRGQDRIAQCRGGGFGGVISGISCKTKRLED